MAAVPDWIGPMLRTVVRTEEQVIADAARRSSRTEREGAAALLEDIELDLIALTFRWKEIKTGRAQVDLAPSEINELFDQMSAVLKSRQERGRAM